MITYISHLTLFVHDQQKALDFYQKLGFIVHTDASFPASSGETERWLTICLPHKRNFEIALKLATTQAQKQIVGAQAPGCPLISLASDDCRQDIEMLRKAGVTIVEDAAEQPWGISAMCKDLYGNLIYVCQEKVSQEKC